MIILDANMDVLLYRWRCRGYGDPQLKYVRVQRAFLKRIFEKKYFSIDVLVNIDTNDMSLKDTVLKVLTALIKRLRR